MAKAASKASKLQCSRPSKSSASRAAHEELQELLGASAASMANSHTNTSGSRGKQARSSQGQQQQHGRPHAFRHCCQGCAGLLHPVAQQGQTRLVLQKQQLPDQQVYQISLGPKAQLHLWLLQLTVQLHIASCPMV